MYTDCLHSCYCNGVSIAVQAEAEEVAATREAQSAGDYKKASKAEEMLSKELVKANSEWTNRKTAYKSELKALEALKESEAEGGAAEVYTLTYIYTINTLKLSSCMH
jgi:hypothetical protein